MSGAIQAARRIFRQLGARRRRQLFGVIALMLLGALADMATIGALLPFLAIVAPVSEFSGAAPRYQALTGPIELAAELLGLSPTIASAGLLIGVAVFGGVARLLLLWVGQRYVFAVGHDLSVAVYARVLHRPYARQVQRNSAETLAAMENVQFVLGNVLLPLMAGVSAAVAAAFILVGLLVIDPVAALLAAGAFAAFYTVISRMTRKRLYRNSDVIAAALVRRAQTLQEGLGGIRDVLLDRTQPVFLDTFARIDHRLRIAQATNQFIAAAPRFAIEALGVVMIAAIAVFVAQRPGGLIGAMPMLGALALGAQRLLPQVQQIYFSGSQIHGNRGALVDVADLLEEPLETSACAPRGDVRDPGPVAFERVSYIYPGAAAPALDGIDLTIARGARIGVVGRSGSGKSTFVDVLMGLLDPDEGQVTVDGRPLGAVDKAAWQAQIAHVPQAIFLADASIAANIAFGRPPDAIDWPRVREAARMAELDAFIAASPQGFDTRVGERGVRLSGGQRQRIGIARALYKQASVLVFDEATSALDDATEAAVMAAIERLPRQLTLVVIAHRLTTLRLCDTIVRLDAGRIVAMGSYQDVLDAANAG